MRVGRVADDRAVADNAVSAEILDTYAATRAAALDKVVSDEACIDRHGASSVESAYATAVYGLARQRNVVRYNRVINHAQSARERNSAARHIVCRAGVVADAAPGNRATLDPRACAGTICRGLLTTSYRDALDFRLVVNNHAAGGGRRLLDDRVRPALSDKRHAASNHQLRVDFEESVAERDSAGHGEIRRRVDRVLYRLPGRCRRLAGNNDNP